MPMLGHTLGGVICAAFYRVALSGRGASAIAIRLLTSSRDYLILLQTRPS